MPKSEEVLVIGAFRFDPDVEALVDAEGQAVTLRPQTARVLGLLAASRGELVTKDRIMEAVWADTHVTDDSLVQCISEIRKALGPVDGALLKTVPKQGYRLNGVAEADRAGEGPRTPSRFVGLVAAVCLVLVVAAYAFWQAREATVTENTTIAVLPFVNMSGDEQQDYLSIGLAEDLLTDLSQISALTTLSRTTTFGFRNMADAAGQIRAEFGATHVVDGSVQRDGDRIRISVQLVETGSGTSLWAERYDREVSDIFDVQDEVRSRIVKALAIRLAPHEEERLQAGGTSEVSAYDLLLRGRYFESSLTREGVTRAIDFYRKALNVDPDYSDAYARLANMYDFSSRFGWGESAEGDRALALEMAERAVRLNPKNPFAYWTRGRVLARLGEAPDSAAKALEDLNKAIELDPNYSDAYAFMALLHISAGEKEEARQAIDAAFRLNREPPSWYSQNRAIISYFEGDFDQAIELFTVAIEQNPTAQFGRLWLAASYAMAGRQDDAEWEVEEAFSLGGVATVSEVLRTNSVITFPEFREAYAEGLRRAGLEE